MMDLEALVGMEYPGRFIILGREFDDTSNIIIYGLTGRSPSSQARKLIATEDSVKIEVTDEKQLKKGNIHLLMYTAIKRMDENNIIVSNGKQTDLIIKHFDYPKSAKEILEDSFKEPYILDKIDLASFEPDKPHYTPRISGIIKDGEIAMNIIKRDKDNSVLRKYYSFELNPGFGKLIATYDGSNKNPLPSFSRSPLDVRLVGYNQRKIAERVVKNINSEFMVSIACMFSNMNIPVIINRVDQK